MPLVVREITLAPRFEPVPSCNQISRHLRLHLHQCVGYVVVVRNASSAIRAQMAQIEVGELVGDGDEPSRRRVIAVIGKLIQVLPRARLRPFK